MIKTLLDGNKNFYKANLHCHSTFSDGKLTVEQIKKEYQNRGYSIVAFTDHDVFICHNELTDNNFLALNGFEIGVDSPSSSWEKTKTCHICYIALDRDNDIHPVWHRSKYFWGNATNFVSQVKYDKNTPDYEREYSFFGINEIMKTGRDKGFFVTINHPAWSTLDYPDFCEYSQMNAVEIYNNGCVKEGYCDFVPWVYDSFLRQGKKISCLANDDNHNNFPFFSPQNDSFGGFTYINADKLDYSTITKALLEGKTYASTGAEITSLIFSNQTREIKVTTPQADRIILSSDLRNTQVRYANSEKLTQATFEISPQSKYIRITIENNGKFAFSNAYFIEDLLK